MIPIRLLTGVALAGCASAYKCPGSGSFIHAWSEVTVVAAASCADVMAEVKARATAQKGWADPHNGGIYSVLTSDATEIDTQRTSNPAKSVGGKLYVDKQVFRFTESPETKYAEVGCTIEACSESQGFSIGDFSTNYCDMRNLYCGAADGCKAILHDFTSTEPSHTTSLGAGHDFSKCIVTPVAPTVAPTTAAPSTREDKCPFSSRSQEAVSDSAHFWCKKSADGKCEETERDQFSAEELRDAVRKAASFSPPLTTSVVDASTIKKKVLAGYQGWVTAGKKWNHWSEGGKLPTSMNAHFELLPELGEYPSGSLYKTGLHYNRDGSAVKLYANDGEGVVDLHFKWMADYGIDGVLLQRFVHDVVDQQGSGLKFRNTVLAHMDAAATNHGRTYALMYDISGSPNATYWINGIKNDYLKYIKKYTSGSRYLKEGGKPVICIWGIGMSDLDKHPADPTSSVSFVRWLQGQGLYVIGSGPYFWRTAGHDAATGFDKFHEAVDAIMPWTVGRYNSVADFRALESNLDADTALTTRRGQDYAPIAFPGYSYRADDKFNKIPRNGGKFFQAQIDAYLKTPGVSFYYVAMFDEVQEGTAIYKVAANENESAEPKGCFLTMSSDGIDLPGDHYLKIVGNFTATAKGPSPPPGPPAPSPSRDSLSPGDRINSGEDLISAHSQARLEMQKTDGNLVLRDRTGTQVWSSNTTGHLNSHVTFQTSDGNLVLRDSTGKAMWSSKAHKGAAKVVLKDNCDLVTEDSSGNILWSLGTSCKASLKEAIDIDIII